MSIIQVVCLVTGVVLLLLVVPLSYFLVANWHLKNGGRLRLFTALQIPFNVAIGILNLHYAFIK